MNVIAIGAETRKDFGKKATKSVRAQGLIPSVMYSKNGVKHFTTTLKEVKSLVYTPDFNLAEIELDGTAHKAFIKSIDFHPVTDSIEHIDFQELVDGQSIRTSLPVRLKGQSPGVLSGGKLITSLRSVKIKATPEHLVDELFVDISGLKLGSSVRVRDLEVPEGIEIQVDPATPVASVVVPRALKDEGVEGEDEEGEGDEESSEEGSSEESGE